MIRIKPCVQKSERKLGSGPHWIPLAADPPIGRPLKMPRPPLSVASPICIVLAHFGPFLNPKIGATPNFG